MTMHPESMRGQRPYMDVLAQLHQQLRPELYLEIGVRHGGSLRLATGPAIGIDPKNQLSEALPDTAQFCEMTSDDFFVAAEQAGITSRFDFAFIDGMHLFEFALRDFINVERHAQPWTLVVFDDICPNHPLQAARDRVTNVWTGDVWKLRDCLRRYRPDLVQVVLDTAPTGLMLVMGLDPSNTVLQDHYDTIVAEYVDTAWEVPAQALQREGALVPSDDMVRSITGLVERVRASDDQGREMRQLRDLMRWRGV